MAIVVILSMLTRQKVDNGAWLSLVEHLAWDQGVAGSNPAAPTIAFKSWIFESSFFYCYFQ